MVDHTPETSSSRAPLSSMGHSWDSQGALGTLKDEV